MALLIYAKASDNVAALVTPTQQTGTANTLYPVTRVNDGDPGTATKSTGTGDYALLWDWGSAQRVDAVWIPMYNMPAGTVVHFQLNATNSWGTPTVDGTVTVPAYGGDLPRGLFLDLTAVSGYSSGGFRYGRLFVPNPSQITAIGEIFIAKQKRTTRNVFVGVNRPRGRKVTQTDRADGGFFVYDRGVNTWSVKGELTGGATYSADYQEMFEDAKGSYSPFAVVLDTHLTTPEGFIVRWVSDFDPTQFAYLQDHITLEWAMVPRGRAL